MNRLVSAAFIALLAGTAYAAPIKYVAFMDGASENPSNASPGIGVATLFYDDAANTLRVQATFADLLAPTTVAHIHCCVAPPGNIGVATPLPTFPGFPAGVTAGAYDQTFDLTLASSWNAAFITANGGTPAGAEAALAAGLLAGQAYFNIHTSLFPAGEIRGFFAVPEPGTLGLLGLALFGAAAFGRRRLA